MVELDCSAMAVKPECLVVVVTKEEWWEHGWSWWKRMRLTPVGVKHSSDMQLSLIRLIRSRHITWPFWNGLRIGHRM